MLPPKKVFELDNNLKNKAQKVVGQLDFWMSETSVVSAWGMISHQLDQGGWMPKLALSDVAKSPSVVTW